jgi:hypothetical protein
MKLSPLLLAALALAGPLAVHADTVYFKQPGAVGIESVSGTIVQETGGAVRIVTADGRTVSIAKPDVYQIIRDEAPAADATVQPAMPDGFRLVREAESGAPAPLDAEAESSRRVHHYGVKAGMNVANMTVDPQELEEGGSLKSYAFGAWWGTPLTRRLTLSAEALYSVRGDAETAGGYTASTHMGYLDVPVLAKVGFLQGAAAQPSLFLGPSLAVNLSASSRLEGGDGDMDLDVKDQVRAFDVGMVVGGALDFTLARRTYGVELRYTRGLSNAVADGANGDARNDVIAVMGSVGLQ